MDRRHDRLTGRGLFALVMFYMFLLTSGELSAHAEGPAGDGRFEINPARRRDQYSLDPGHFVYPICAEIPGMGAAKGLGGTAVNVFGSDTDLTGFYLRGDFDTTGAAILNQHLLRRFLILDFAYYDYRSSTMSFDRGINSSPDQYVLPETKGNAWIGQLTFTFWERKLETYTRFSGSRYELLRVKDAAGNSFENLNTGDQDFRRLAVGAKVDLTDDKLDPRNGIRIESEATKVLTTIPDVSEYYTIDTNISAFVPFFKRDTLGFNLFNSRAIVTKGASTDPEYLRGKIGLGCAEITDPAQKAKCLDAENKTIDERVRLNRYGKATSLGGTQRLRSFPNGRYTAGNALFAGSEFRWNLTDEKTFMNWFFLKGVRTNLQLAFFGELGTVSESFSEAFRSSVKHSYGTGFRAVFSGVTLRFDFAYGNEGSQFQMFLDYPWNLYAIDSGV